MGAYIFQPLKTVYTHSAITRARISASLLGRIESEETRTRKSIARSGLFFFLFLRTKKKNKSKKNPLYGKSLPRHVLDAAAIKAGTPVYVYDQETFTLINNTPFRSLRDTAKNMPVSDSTLVTKLNTNKPFKGFYYFTSPQPISPT